MSTQPHDSDDVWDDLVARLEATDSSSVQDPEPDTSDPGSPRSPEEPDTTGSTPTDETMFPSLASPAVGPLAPRGPRDWDEPDEEELADSGASDFVPETPGPILAGRPGVVIACIAAIGMPVLMLVLLVTVADRVPGTGWAMMGLTAVAALVYLAWSLPRHRADDGDDGARV